MATDMYFVDFRLFLFVFFLVCCVRSLLVAWERIGLGAGKAPRGNVRGGIGLPLAQARKRSPRTFSWYKIARTFKRKTLICM